MMSGGFRDDPGALANASQGIDGVLYDVSNNKVSDVKVLEDKDSDASIQRPWSRVPGTTRPDS